MKKASIFCFTRIGSRVPLIRNVFFQGVFVFLSVQLFVDFLIFGPDETNWCGSKALCDSLAGSGLVQSCNAHRGGRTSTWMLHEKFARDRQVGKSWPRAYALLQEIHFERVAGGSAMGISYHYGHKHKDCLFNNIDK